MTDGNLTMFGAGIEKNVLTFEIFLAIFVLTNWLVKVNK